ncbi:HNH endonuclease [Paenibacillus sp. GCM10027627]|uniref:HNH endonuclease n=1 Tax=unclassified Paenibacillus TaxID=185978 RepID=UPI003629B8DF
MTTTSTTDNRPSPEMKPCTACGVMKPLGEFLRRTGRRKGKHGRRGTCRACRSTGSSQVSGSEAGTAEAATIKERTNAGAATVRKRNRGARKRKGGTAPPPQAQPLSKEKERPLEASSLRPTAQGFIRMRGKTDNGRRWYQEIEPELASILVNEGAAVVVNRQTIKRLYSNKEFRQFILTRDNYTCRFCGQYGDTIDHVLPRAKGGHTTPVNCVCACYECNQLKAGRDVDEFIKALE